MTARITMIAAVAMAVGLGCGVEIPDGRYSCTTSVDCPPDFTCRADNLCYREGEGGVADTSIVDGGLDAPDGDADGGCTDDDDDTYCGDDPDLDRRDCDDGEALVFPGANEQCDGAFEGRDDNCDGQVDEACPFSVGVVHSPVRLHMPAAAEPSPGFFFGPELSADGLSLYYAHFGDPNAPLYVATRPTLRDEFEDPRSVRGTTDLGLGFALLSITGDELEVFVQATSSAGTTTIYTATRPTRADAFGMFVPVPTVMDSPGKQAHPSISRDGLQLFYVHDTVTTKELRRVQRADRSSPFGAHDVIVDVTENPQFPRLWEDGRTLVYSSNRTPPVQMLERETPDEPFGLPRPFPHVPPGFEGSLYFFSSAAHEMWFTIEGPHPEAATGTAMFRAQVCRQDVCALPEPVECAAGDSRTANRLRCFHRTDRVPSIDTGRILCGTFDADTGENAASVHTDEEAALLDGLGWDGYIGLERASTGDPFLWDNGDRLITERWSMGVPSTRALDLCVYSDANARWNAIPCDTTSRTICVRDLWPVFVPSP